MMLCGNRVTRHFRVFRRCGVPSNGCLWSLRSVRATAAWNRSPTPGCCRSYQTADSSTSSRAPGRYSTGLDFIQSAANRSMNLFGANGFDFACFIFIQAAVNLPLPRLIHLLLVLARDAGVKQVGQLDSLVRREFRLYLISLLFQSDGHA